MNERKPRKGDRLDVAVAGLDGRGFAFGDAEGDYRVRLRHAVPGSTVVADVGKRCGARIDARLDSVVDPGPHTRAASCPHFGPCGGCSFQTTEYAIQVREKRRIVQDALAGAGVEGEVEPVLACDDPWHYRNKMDFTFSNRRWVVAGEGEDVARDFALGLHVPARHEKVLDIGACAIQFEGGDAILNSVRDLAREQGLAPWDIQAHQGLLRHLVLRKGVRTGEILVDLVTSDDAPDVVGAFADALLARHPEITTFVQNVNTRPAAIAVGEREHVLFGPGVLREELCGLTFTVSANSFFQTNTVQAERMFEVVREEASVGEVVYDLYCGAGVIGLVLASTAREVWGFESVGSAVDDARRNAEVNGLTGVHFVHGDVLDSLREEAADRRPRPDVCVLDPPRAGLHPKALAAVIALAPRRLVYVSCNVQAAARDLSQMLAAGYGLGRIRPIDLFPHTPHVECVFGLERK
ncbi:MAG: 23S rRNA (uracil(1939)-C(5))-methyltransferase RlmD [bacterium]|nr:23S rRNA (uracil(1939)-C(5))-methyltransferase RlmD [bacterium]